MTLLKIVDKPENFLWKKPLCFLPVNRVRVERTSLGDVSVKKITYINRNGRVNPQKIRKATGEEEVLLYGDVTRLSGKVKVFEPSPYLGRLAVNLSLACLQMLSKNSLKVTVGFYDPRGEFSDCVERLSLYSKELVVVTENTALYEEESRRLLWERGTPLAISRRGESLKKCSLVVSPVPISREMNFSEKSVLLTCKRPKIMPKCKVYYDYNIKLPGELFELSEFLGDRTLLAAGLYCIHRKYSLGSVVPLVGSGESEAQTYLSLCRYFIEHLT